VKVVAPVKGSKVPADVRVGLVFTVMAASAATVKLRVDGELADPNCAWAKEAVNSRPNAAIVIDFVIDLFMGSSP